MDELAVVTNADRRDLGEQLTAVFRPIWPEFIFHDPIDAEYSSRVERYFPQYDVLVLDGAEIVTGGCGVPIRWDGTVGDLPDGYDEAMIRAVTGHESSVPPDTLCIMAAAVRPGRQGSGLAGKALAGPPGLERLDTVQVARRRPIAASTSERPEDVRFISGLILVSRQAERLAQFYRDVLGVPLAEERHDETRPHWGCELGDVHFAIHPAEDYPDDPAGGPGPVKLAFLVLDLPRMVTWLDKCGVAVCYPPADLGSESQITAVRDPDGNLVELTQLGPGWLDHLKAHRAEGHDLVASWSAHLTGRRPQ